VKRTITVEGEISCEVNDTTTETIEPMVFLPDGDEEATVSNEDEDEAV
jgi:hypothetical protein